LGGGMVLKIYNTLTRRKEEFIPMENKKVRIYVCGPTVYGPSHLGHARTYIAFDIIRRFLEYLGYEVKFVMNITDVHDDIIEEANRLNTSVFELSKKFTKIFFEDMEKLKIKKADFYPKVTEHIPDIVNTINILLKKGYAYIAGGSVYFDISKFKDYGKLSRIKLEKMKVGVRIETDKYKEEPFDFALWKAWKKGEPFWNATFETKEGKVNLKGRPGWHIECSVMSQKYLGEQFDLHGGARDLIFPHHENEIAQSEAATGKKPFVRYWYHTGFLTINGEKMSKSLRNYIEVRDILKKYDAEVLRFFFITAHFRSPIDFTEEGLGRAKTNLETLYNLLDRVSNFMKKEKVEGEDELENFLNKTRKEFINAMNDDFNTPLALSHIFSLVNEVNRFLDKNGKISEELGKKIIDTLKELGYIFGILQKDIKKEELPKEIMDLIMKREEHRKRGEFEIADKIREELRKKGIIIEDTPEGPKWKKVK
jgi:cysteinyl-tRNA synthetase